MPRSKKSSRHVRRTLVVASALVIAYAAVAYVAVPLAWEFVFARKGQPAGVEPRLTETADHRPGDPLNVMLVADEATLKDAMAAAGWFEADPLGVRTGVDIAVDILLNRPYRTAPVSRLFLFGRSEDLAFEKPAGPDPDTRHHVRLWRMAPRPGWPTPRYIGAASFDKGIGLSRETGQVTHHIAAEVDLERDGLRDDLMKAGRLIDSSMTPGFHAVREGVNGGGDAWVTDGALWTGVVGGKP